MNLSDALLNLYIIFPIFPFFSRFCNIITKKDGHTFALTLYYLLF